MRSVICKNNVVSLVEKLQEYTENGGIVKCIHVIDITEDQCVILVSDKDISNEAAQIWWDGYQAALGYEK